MVVGIFYSEEDMDNFQKKWDGFVGVENTLIATERLYYDKFNEDFHIRMCNTRELNKAEEEWKCTWRKCSDKIKINYDRDSLAFLVHPCGYIIRASHPKLDSDKIFPYSIIRLTSSISCTPVNRKAECFHPRYLKIMEARKVACLSQLMDAKDAKLANESVEMELICYMNRYFAHVEDSQMVYIKVVHDTEAAGKYEEVKIEAYTLKAFHDSYPSANITALLNNKTELHACSYWLKHEHHRWYDTTTIAASTRSRILNLFSGLLATKEELEGVDEDEALLLTEHIHYVWCKGNLIHFYYTIKWLAHLVQYPCTKMRVALVLQSVEGAGKGIVVQKLKDILGRHFKSLGMESVTGQFNGQLLDCLLLFLDEALYSGDKSIVGKLKRLITESTHQINEKFAKTITTANQLNIIVATNNTWAVPVERTDRRYFVLECANDRASGSAEDAIYFDRLAAVSSEAFLKLLLSIDISDFNPAIMPMTEAKRVQKEITLEIVPSWWLSMLRDQDNRFFDLEGNTNRILSKKDIYQFYVDWHKQNSVERYIESYTRFWVEMKKMVQHEDMRVGTRTSQVYSAKLPTFDVAKERFGRYVKDPEFLNETST